MSFTNSVALAFTTASIRTNAPAASGVYGLSNARQWLYIGETANIQESLLRHLQESTTSRENVPVGFSYELSSAGNRQTRQDRLIVELAPLLNRTPQVAPPQRRS